MSQIALSDLNAASFDDFVAVLENVVEYSPWIAQEAAARRPFAGINSLLDAIKAAIASAEPEVQLALIRAHPDLANKTQRAAGLTPDSTAEQSSAGLDRLSDTEYAAFERANNAYREKFGIPYIVCARRHTKDSILRDFESRLQNIAKTETRRALEEISRIAALRLDQLVSADDKLKVHGRLSTHVLDNHAGKPASGIPVELVELANLGESRVIARAVTNADGRTDQPLIGGRPLPIGRYELRFSVAKYYAERNVQLTDPPFLDEIPLRFAISEPESHYHVPLLVTPWSYSTYRGS
ncbi:MULTISPECIES: 2-oxo-4-hydroxy-4-carboxy-5-ureidoimidazoline decarboxylase [Bradyrhizobium]|jgi:2-oxo-4-hydroxy-4-carboxy-5-ureidoimidazoline decarboxylase|uniref:2-oxo-4-hydroxy-4-carboxy-5-ureidoimidazoline decarboxylase n=1 Tax=Bradyrhizobium TaxID=374 RepID=UPI000378E7B0|nr:MULTISPECIES: 2-oxo-4-hydroxy-4-carboxy-5-ureidoimidazoline decarboxylase [Bradyrhizobium]MBM7484238.1 2-oxo-4-hydroxy-4-carboxy-5-ureidoimidazoline decarboxylase [Bradyrhizobium canariense]MCK1266602.1 2-oxo-4-hydroxy-4-carboxy-5-ureidoimidazoline decarboxylase [Bradyrhizobium sp. 84]MCK1309379.1 2-oxo-4-hydroxy-4-carboxy-5-ureidoimidazoline decarboxylase [Bradyrhizobium sp. 45]MCK1371113.1 2-oxo-4-hydroxy-4-carboxy-5-ureidoimidazoline decarboxylase [Bradyrhizobium sp. 49]MCK1416664.1 2-ox